MTKIVITIGRRTTSEAQQITDLYLSAQGLTGVENTAVKAFVQQLEDAGIYDKFVSIHLKIGVDKKLNLVDPFVLDDALYHEWHGTPTPLSAGLRFNGTSDWIDTKIAWKRISTSPSLGVSYYDQDEMPGCYFGSDVLVRCVQRDGFDNAYINIGGISAAIPTTASRKGFHFFQRKDDDTVEYYQNGSLVGSPTFTPSGVPEGTMYENNEGSFVQSAVHTNSYSAVHLEMTSTQQTDYYNAVQTLMTALGRNI